MTEHTLQEAAGYVASDFLSTVYRNVRPFDVTVARNTILDCLFSSEEPDFIAKITEHRLHRSDSRRVIDKMAPHLVELCGRTLEAARS